ncbi:CynX/NimT family MFS transporter [Companilactobacillus sp.]|uniref:CynX/NimT family MFS transporter n=1 Tax=Companilactobacillus sp. TaxID=2767905 RepID=UPI0025B8EBF6|nr:MFS transporter [Companilactobacillus sp.]MCH4010047.1 MFS transporter [Companilactobacillus sp.]MCH4052277.1 MFS transporter [Companilactobacillus sp.]MCH4077989.1 MFS transporter [Companilactobacillus sp.]MCH4126565.1 MFS transporter [Companilactobacillus sp.]MCH4132151.1 MFS transporter [Companilactobacillus sp.]
MKTKNQSWFIISMMLIAANLRLPITIIPPLLKSIEKNLGVPGSLMGLVTSIPLIAFAVFSPIIVKIAKKFGNELTVFLFFIILIVGSYLRIIPSIWALFIGTTLVGIGIDSGNVLVPAMIKDHLPTKIPLGTGLYTLSMLLIGAIGTALSGIFITKISLGSTLAILSALSIVALIVWIPNLRSNTKDTVSSDEEESVPNYRTVWNQSVGWLITVYFGLQSLVYYSLLTWVPSVIESHGVSTVVSSNILTLLQLSGLPCSFIVPMFASKVNGRRFLSTFLIIGYVLGPMLFLLDIKTTWILVIISFLTGFGSGIAFNEAIYYFTNKTTNPYQTAEVSGMAQSAGYLLAAFGPVLFGFLHELVNSWSVTMIIMSILSVVLVVSGIIINHHEPIAEH